MDYFSSCTYGIHLGIQESATEQKFAVPFFVTAFDVELIQNTYHSDCFCCRLYNCIESFVFQNSCTADECLLKSFRLKCYGAPESQNLAIVQPAWYDNQCPYTRTFARGGGDTPHRVELLSLKSFL